MLVVVFLGAISVGVAQVPPALAPVYVPTTYTPPTAPAPPPPVDKAQCAVDGVAAIDDLSDAAMFAWAASKRCGDPKGSKVECEIDIASAAQSASQMIGTIAGAVSGCGAVNADADCAAAVTDLTGAAAGLAAASGGIANSCPSAVPAARRLGETDQLTNMGNCVFDAKDSVRGLFEASKSMSEAANCKNAQCDSNAVVSVMSALAGMGSSLAASVSDCSSVNGAGSDQADCASAVLALVQGLNDVAAAGKALKAGCSAGAARLYVEDKQHKDDETATRSSPLVLALAAALPMAAALSFAAGRRSRASYKALAATDEETATPCE
jgi:hypothetical protein